VEFRGRVSWTGLSACGNRGALRFEFEFRLASIRKIFSRGPRFCGAKRRRAVFPGHGRIRHFPTVDLFVCAGESRQAVIPSPLRRGTLAKTEQSNGRATSPEIATRRRFLFRSGWQHSTKARTPAPLSPLALSL
jgi:hypothetical protein